MPQATRTVMTGEQGQALASAILQLANAITHTDGLMGASPRAQAARDLVHDIAFPDHVEEPSPAHMPVPGAPAGVDQAKVVAYHPALTYKKGAHVLCGTSWYEAQVDTALGTDLTSTGYRLGSWSYLGEHVDVRSFDGADDAAPSCDAPHCDCDTGEDCHANGAADPVQDSYGRLKAATMAELRGRLSALRAEQRERHEVVTASVAGNVVTVRKGSRGRMFDIEMLWGLPDVSEPFAGVTEHARVIAACDAKLDGLKAAVDALAEHLDRGPATGTKENPVRIQVRDEHRDRLGMKTWVAKVDLRRVGPGRYVRSQFGLVAYVCSMITDLDGKSRLSVDVVNGEG